MGLPKISIEGEVLNEEELCAGRPATNYAFQADKAAELMRSLYGPEIHRQMTFTVPPGSLGPEILGFWYWLRIRAQHKVRQARLRLGEWVAGQEFDDGWS